ncbi:hypothetical protein [Myxococcus stipitatus]|uniref:SitA5 family polymorphic toxin n=1 Tax=Myxococcus stipitatus TaxID=83455 RepID=UPI0030D0A9D7
MVQLLLEMHFSVRTDAERTVGLQRASWESPRRDGGFSLLDESARRKMAMSFAWDGVWGGVQDVVKDVVNPLTLKLMLSSAMAAYMFLVVAPEPVTKLVAIALTTYVIAYIGVDAFVNLVEGWRRLSVDSERAVSFGELQDAGQRFGEVMGANGARVLILALTMALGGGAANIASKGPMLPGFARAALAMETNAGVQMSAALSGGVRSVSLANGALTVGLAPGAVVATAWSGETGSDAAASAVGDGHGLKNVYNGVRSAPGYPSEFKALQNGTTRHRVANKDLLEKLRELEPGEWTKVYRDGWVGPDKVSLHYFESASGKVFNFKVKPGWSNS